MAPKNLLQDTVEYNRKINRTRKMLKSKKSSQYPLPLKLTRPIQSGIPATVPVESVKILKKGISSTKINNKPHASKNHRNTKQNCDHTRYRVTSKFVDELLDSLTTTTRTRMTKSQSILKSNPDLSGLPTRRYKLPPNFIEEMLDNLVISKKFLENYRPSTLVENLLNSL